MARAKKKTEEVIIDVEPTAVAEEPVVEASRGNVTRMNMHRLLRALKTYDDRIEKIIEDGTFVATLTDKHKDYKDPDILVNKINSDYQRLNALMNNKIILEQAKIMSNSTTTCVIGGKTYTVAEAIKRKERLKMEKQVLEKLKRQKRYAEAEANRVLADLNDDLTRKIKSIFGETPENPAEVETYIARYEQEHAPKFVDPLGIDALINILEKDIIDFEIEVDAVLNESNAITVVEVVLDGNE